jgi:hypothetical protein
MDELYELLERVFHDRLTATDLEIAKGIARDLYQIVLNVENPNEPLYVYLLPDLSLTTFAHGCRHEGLFEFEPPVRFSFRYDDINSKAGRQAVDIAIFLLKYLRRSFCRIGAEGFSSCQEVYDALTALRNSELVFNAGNWQRSIWIDMRDCRNETAWGAELVNQGMVGIYRKPSESIAAIERIDSEVV